MQRPDTSNPRSTTPQNSTQPVLKMELKVEAPKASATPVNNPAQPDRKVEVPKYVVCMASDAAVDEAAINAVIANKRAK